MSFRRLHSKLLPLNYSLNLNVDIENDQISGTVKISCQFSKHAGTTETIELNFKGLNIKTCSLNGDDTIFKTLVRDEENDRISFNFSERPISENNHDIYTLEISFDCHFQKDLTGFYRSLSQGSSVKACTMFCPTEARTCLPCFDEPAHKATFDVTLNVKNSDNCKTVLSNSPLLLEFHGDEYSTFKFDTTPKMSSYLLTFVIGNLDYFELATKSKIRVRCYTPVGQSGYGRFATETAVKALEFYEDYFGMPYPVESQVKNLKKLDMVPLKECGCGAMENWGIITYRESLILFDPEKSSYEDQQRIMLIVAHEIAHQWFGNLTTMEWWTEIWLNEGFATFCQYFCAQNILPELKPMEGFMTSCLSEAFNLDKLSSSHPIEITINNPSEIAQVFDAISYRKGASIIRMMFHWIGEANFKKGLNNYFKKFAYGNAKTLDLWSEFEAVSNLPVARVMGSWTDKKGFPVLVRDVENPNIISTVGENTWEIPVFYKEVGDLKSSVVKVELMTGDQLILEPANGLPVCLNPNRYGFYRVIESVNQLPATFSNDEPGKVEKLKHFSDLFNAFEMGKSDIVTYLKFVRTHILESVECSKLVLTEFLEHVSRIGIIFGCDKLARQFADVYSDLEVLQQVDPSIRARVVNSVLAYGRSDLFSSLESLESLQLNSSLPKFIYQGKYQSDKVDLVGRYKQADATEKQLLATAIIKTLDSGRCLPWIISVDVADCDKPYYFIQLASQNTCSRDLVWNHLVKHQKQLSDKYAAGVFLLPRLFKGVIELYNTAEKVGEFCQNHKLDTARQGINQGYESVVLNERICSENCAAFEEFSF